MLKHIKNTLKQINSILFHIINESLTNVNYDKYFTAIWKVNTYNTKHNTKPQCYIIHVIK